MATASKPTPAQRDLARRIVDRQMPGKPEKVRQDKAQVVAGLIAAGHSVRD